VPLRPILPRLQTSHTFAHTDMLYTHTLLGLPVLDSGWIGSTFTFDTCHLPTFGPVRIIYSY